MNAYIYGVINTVIYTVMCNLFSTVLLGKIKIQRKTEYILCITGWIFLEFLVSVFLDRYILMKMVIVILFNIIFMKVLYRAGMLKTCGTACLYQAVCVFVDYLSFVLVRKVVGQINVADNTDTFTGYLIGMFSQVLIFLFIIWFRSNFGLEKDYAMTGIQWIKFMVVPIFSVITILAFVQYFDANMTYGQKNTILFVVFGLALMNLFVLHLVLDVIWRENERKKEELMSGNLQQTEKLYVQARKQYEELLRQRHDYRNQMLVIQSLLENGEYDRIRKYIGKYCVETEGGEWFDTNHSVVNAILNIKYMDALSRKILMVVQFNDLSKIPLEDRDIISVFSNLLDNAIEASEKCTEKSPWIKVKFVVEEKRMLLAVSNMWNGRLQWHNGRILSSKKDETNHGYGMENVKRIVEKNHGFFTVDWDEEVFKVVVSIPII